MAKPGVAAPPSAAGRRWRRVMRTSDLDELKRQCVALSPCPRIRCTRTRDGHSTRWSMAIQGSSSKGSTPQTYAPRCSSRAHTACPCRCAAVATASWARRARSRPARCRRRACRHAAAARSCRRRCDLARCRSRMPAARSRATGRDVRCDGHRRPDPGRARLSSRHVGSDAGQPRRGGSGDAER